MHSDGLGQIARLVYITAASHRQVVRQQLKRDGRQDTLAKQTEMSDSYLCTFSVRAEETHQQGRIAVRNRDNTIGLSPVAFIALAT
jgi:hypothetical protein